MRALWSICEGWGLSESGGELNEGNFRQHLQKGLESQGCFCYKPPDLARALVKPCDLIVGIRGRLWLIECKLRKLPGGRIPPEANILIPSLFRPHQIPTLLQVERQGQGEAFVAVLAVPEEAPKKREAWLLRASTVARREGKITQHQIWDIAYPLTWVPNVGWTVPQSLCRR